MTIVDGVRLVSNSEVQTFKDCPRRWWLAWYRGLTLRTEDVGSPAATGTRVHKALAAYYVPEGQTSADPLKTLEELQNADLHVLQDRTAAHSDEAWIGEQAQDALTAITPQFDLEHAMISGYLEWLAQTGEDADLEVIEPEAYVEASIGLQTGGRETKLIGKLDARVRSRLTGRRRFIDHKTVGSLHDPLLGLNQQMLHYHLIEWLNTFDTDGDRCDGALYNMLRKTKRTPRSTPPFYARVPIDHNQYELDGYLKQLYGVIRHVYETEQLLAAGVDHHTAVPSRPSRDCTWKCPFFRVCRMFDDGSRVEAALESLYVQRDPLDYYGGKHLDHE